MLNAGFISTMERLIHLLLFTGLCLVIQSVSCEYVLVQESKTWDDAEAYCKTNQLELAMVRSTEDWTSIQRAVGTGLTSPVWVGLYNNNDYWWWSYQSESEFVNWAIGEPNNMEGNEDCVAVTHNGWTDQQCNEKYPFFCYLVSETGSNMFIFISKNLSWSEAQDYCKVNYTDLANIFDENENYILMNITEKYDRAWIGKDKFTWGWIDGYYYSTSSIRWRAGQPDYTGMNRYCGAVGPDGLIEDQPCTNTLAFICKSFTKKHIVRVEVKSGQNPNNPALLETILQQMNQKLKARGVDNTTLTWRQQPDGNVFSPEHDHVENNNDCRDLPYAL